MPRSCITLTLASRHRAACFFVIVVPIHSNGMMLLFQSPQAREISLIVLTYFYIYVCVFPRSLCGIMNCLLVIETTKDYEDGVSWASVGLAVQVCFTSASECFVFDRASRVLYPLDSVYPFLFKTNSFFPVSVPTSTVQSTTTISLI